MAIICIITIDFASFLVYYKYVKSVFEFQDYRLAMREFYEARKRMVGFSWREFAKLAGYASPVYLKLVTEGKTSLSELGMERVASAMGLTGREAQYFRLLVRFNQESNAVVKKEVLKEMRLLSRQAQVTLVGTEQYDYYQTWHNSVLRELVPNHPGASDDELGRKLLPPLSGAKVRKAIDLLVHLGLLQTDSQGKLVQTQKSISTGSEISSMAVRDLHRQMGTLAVESLDRVDPSERDISGLTLGLSSQTFLAIQSEIADFRRRVVAIATADADAENAPSSNHADDRVYRLNLQLFPLTRGQGDKS